MHNNNNNNNNSNGRQLAGSSSFPYVPGGPSSNGAPSVVSASPRERDICRFFVNGGCTRGETCPYLHELPDERYLDVAGLGFIMHSDVHNGQKAMPASSSGATAHLTPPSLGGSTRRPASTRGTKPLRATLPATPGTAPRPPTRYRPPEPYLDENLPPALAHHFRSEPKELPAALTNLLLQM